MAYMNRLGIWGSGTPFPEFNDFIQSVEKRSVTCLTLFCFKFDSTLKLFVFLDR